MSFSIHILHVYIIIQYIYILLQFHMLITGADIPNTMVVTDQAGLNNHINK